MYSHITSAGPCFHTRSPGTPRGSWLMAMTSGDFRRFSVRRLMFLLGTPKIPSYLHFLCGASLCQRVLFRNSSGLA